LLKGHGNLAAVCHSDHEDNEAVVVDLVHHAVVADADAVLAGTPHQAFHPVRAGIAGKFGHGQHDLLLGGAIKFFSLLECLASP
jgi:hypothetical protein